MPQECDHCSPTLPPHRDDECAMVESAMAEIDYQLFMYDTAEERLAEAAREGVEDSWWEDDIDYLHTEEFE